MKEIIVGGIIEKDGKYLLVQEAQEKCKGKWNIPAGHLDPNETIIEGAKREIEEETGCKVEITNILQIGNRIMNDKTWIGVNFQTKLIDENIKYDKNEVLNVKWFTYDEIINMKSELRCYDWIIDAIEAHKNKRTASLDIIKVFY